MSHWHWRALQKAAKEIRDRTTARSWYDSIRGEFCVGYSSGGYPSLIHSWPVKSVCGLIEYDFRGIEPTTVDDIVYTVQLAAVDESKKQRWVAAHAKRRTDEERKRKEDHYWGMAPGVMKESEQRRKNRVTVAM